MTEGSTKRNPPNRYIFFTGGGTAGHVFPGLAVAEELKKHWDGEIIWIGSKKGPEKRMVEEAGLPFEGISAGKMRRYFSLKNVIDIFKIGFGFLKASRLCRKYRPLLVFSKGGYVSVPAVFAAGRKGIPVITHESDSDPGLATRLNGRYAEKICVAFPETAECFEGETRKRTVVTGNPVRSFILNGNGETGRKWLNAPEGKKILLIVGGSQGAKQINDMVRPVLPALKKEYFIVHQTGKHDFLPSDDPDYRTFPFIGGEMPHVLAAADLVVSRAGANALAEFSLTGKTAVLVPLMGGAGRGDQVKNAELYERAGAAVNLCGERATPENLLEAVRRIKEDESFGDSLRKAAAGLAHRGAAEKISEEILGILGRTDGHRNA